ncbi:MAG: 2-phosphosulfolactate phosphatase, partial [Candidatus Eisenbacteria bacterium]|nr:2-phosphosulfolactate phosphatase [Candidatus Eisenbacteria bacterium]
MLQPHEARPRGPLEAALVVDVLRATTTLTAALSNGAREVIPVATPAEGFAARARRPDALLCGERGGRIVDGFDLGNSPFEYTAERVRGRTLVFASTNGSLALLAARGLRRVPASFANLTAAVDRVWRASGIVIVCAGKEGAFALVQPRDQQAGAGSVLERECTFLAGAVRSLVEGSRHGRDLSAMGRDYARDVTWCATLDSMSAAFE